MEPKEFEAWGRAVVERAAELVHAAIPEAQQPEQSKTARAVRAGQGYISRYVHFRHPKMQATRSVWLFAVPAGHAYDWRPAHDRVAAGLKHNVDDELDSNRFAAGMTSAFPFTWKNHLDQRYEGYRLGVKVDPAADAPEDRAQELAEQVLKGLRGAGLLG